MYRLLICLAFCLWFLSLTCYNCYSQIYDANTESFLENRITIKFNDDEELFLKTLARKAKIPLGFYQLCGTGENGELKKISIDAKQETIQNILNEFIKEDSRYKWSVVNGVINITPQKQPELLKVSVSKVDFENIKLEDAEFAIFELPEVQTALSNLSVTASKISVSYGPEKNQSLFSLKLESITVQQILNEIILNKYGYYWTIEQYGENFKYIKVTLL